MNNSKILIRKYSDRRLYNTGCRRYVNLDDIARLVREGADVEVRDASTGKDLTRMTLTQIIVENARQQETALPVQLLQQLIKASDRATHDVLSSYLDSAFHLYERAQETLRSSISEAKTAVSNPLEFLRHMVAAQSEPSRIAAGETEKLRRRIVELEARLAELELPKRRPRKRNRRPE